MARFQVYFHESSSNFLWNLREFHRTNSLLFCSETSEKERFSRKYYSIEFDKNWSKFWSWSLMKFYATPPSQFVITWVDIFIILMLWWEIESMSLVNYFVITIYHITGVKTGMKKVDWNFNHYLIDI